MSDGPSQPSGFRWVHDAPKQESRASRWLLRALLVAVVSLGVIVFAGTIGKRVYRMVNAHGRAARAIEPYAKTLVGEPVANDGKPDYGPTYGRTTGGIVIVDATTGTVDPAFWELPSEVIARDASAIGTVVRTECRESGGPVAGRPGKSASVYMTGCRLTVIDWAARTIIGRGYAHSPEEVPKYLTTAGFTGSRPNEGIANWVASLPRQ